MVQYTVK